MTFAIGASNGGATVAMFDVDNSAGQHTITYKVRATRGKRYKVSPTKGVVAAGGKASVAVTLQATAATALLAKGSRTLDDQFQVHTKSITDKVLGRKLLATQKRGSDPAKFSAQLKKVWVESGVDETSYRVSCGLDLSHAGSTVKFAVRCCFGWEREKRKKWTAWSCLTLTH